MLLHAPINRANRLEQWRAIETIKQEGKCRSIGLANCESNHVEETLKNSTSPPVLLQREISIFNQQTDLVEFCADNSIMSMAIEPLAKGVKLSFPPLLDFVRRKKEELRGEGGVSGFVSSSSTLSAAYVCLKHVMQRGLLVVVSPDDIPLALRVQEEMSAWSLTEDDMMMMNAWGEAGLSTAWQPSEEEEAL